MDMDFLLPGPVLRRLQRALQLLLLVLMPLGGLAQEAAPRAQGSLVAAGGQSQPHPDRSVTEWLLRMHEASRRRAYIGTYVVAAEGRLASAKIWHVCDGTQQMERVESLTGAPRSTFRHNEQVITFFPGTRVARTEVRSSTALFPGLLLSADAKVDDFYSAKRSGQERIAGVDADVVVLVPKDAWRFGYRIWTEAQTGLVVKLQTLDDKGQILEQVAFSELQLDAPVNMEKLAKMMANTDGYRVEKSEPVRTTASAEGWGLRRPVDGFRPVSCLRRTAATVTGGSSSHGTVQWIFSDGLASVSLFLEPYDRQRHGREAVAMAGATRTLTHRLQDWWVTAVGEVPAQTLQAFAENLVRVR